MKLAIARRVCVGVVWAASLIGSDPLVSPQELDADEPVVAQAAPPAEILTNESIMTMVKAGIAAPFRFVGRPSTYSTGAHGSVSDLTSDGVDGTSPPFIVVDKRNLG